MNDKTETPQKITLVLARLLTLSESVGESPRTPPELLFKQARLFKPGYCRHSLKSSVR